MVLTLGIVLSLVCATIGTIFAPSVCELAAPVLCPGAKATATRSIPSIGRRGGRTILWVSYCSVESAGTEGAQTPLRNEVAMNPIAARAVLLGYGVLLSLVIASALWLKARHHRAAEQAGPTRM
jgi:hypothetical protein